METYHKINAPFKRDERGKLIDGDWAVPEIGYLARNQWEFTEKVDGTNIRIHLKRHQDYFMTTFGGRTDRATIPPYLLTRLESLFPYESSPSKRGGDRGYLIGNWMVDHSLTDVVLFGEGYGPKIQNGEDYSSDHDFVLFDVKVGDFWLDRAGVDNVADELGIQSVPTLGHGSLYDAIDIVSSGITFNDAGAIKRWGNGTLHSRWGEFPAEGIVARPVVPLFDRHGNRIITKIKRKDFR